jgi:DNA-binding HxlR family transcriptional regulator
MRAIGDFCTFEKAVEHLADRWSLLIVREVALHGTRGFNALATGLPGVSRSVLARRLRKLESLGVLARASDSGQLVAPYRLTRAGAELVPVLQALNEWAERWEPDDPARAAIYDPEVILYWLRQRIAPESCPDPPAVIVLDLDGHGTQPAWIVVEQGTEPSMCEDDPVMQPERYVYVDADAAALYPISRGLTSWGSAIAARHVRLSGVSKLVEALPAWFRPVNDIESLATTPP